MTNDFKPFQSEDSELVITDKHGNELNVHSEDSELVIFGQWQGKIDAPEFVSFLSMLKQAQEILVQEKIVTKVEKDGFSLSKKKDEVLLDVDVTLIKNEDSAGKILKLFNKVNKMKV